MDIAHRAGVSQATVSRVLRGSPLVNAETRKRVEEAVRELNYKVDRHASSLRTQRAGTLALLLFEDPTPDDSHINPFFLSMLGSITRACARHGHDLLVSFQQLSDDWHADYEDSMKADGLILLGYGDYLAYESKLAHLVAQGTHFVRWGAVLPGQPGISIGCDNAEGGALAGRHLVGLGRKKIAFLGDASTHFPEFFARYCGCDAALREAGLRMNPALQVDAASTEQAGYEAARMLIARELPFDAVFAARPDRHWRDACLEGSRSARARRRGRGRFRRHADVAVLQSAADHGGAGHLPRRRAAGGHPAAPGARRAGGKHHHRADAGGSPVQRGLNRLSVGGWRRPSPLPARLAGKAQ